MTSAAAVWLTMKSAAPAAPPSSPPPSTPSSSPPQPWQCGKLEESVSHSSCLSFQEFCIVYLIQFLSFVCLFSLCRLVRLVCLFCLIWFDHSFLLFFQYMLFCPWSAVETFCAPFPSWGLLPGEPKALDWSPRLQRVVQEAKKEIPFSISVLCIHIRCRIVPKFLRRFEINILALPFYVQQWVSNFSSW